VPSRTLHFQIESELPQALVVGSGTALFVCGWCYSPDARIRSLALVVDGERQAVLGHGMPRLDPFVALHPTLDPFQTEAVEDDPASADDPQLHSYASGFWGVARIAPRASARDCRLELRAELDDGGTAIAHVARIPISTLAAPLSVNWPHAGRGPAVAICLASYNPPTALLQRQIESIRAQSHRNWICVISDDCSNSDRWRELQQLVDGDPRFYLSRSPRRLGFYHNFERALALAPADAEFVALADQDDFWYADKLETLLNALGDRRLVYSDARVVTRDGALISDTWWNQRHNNHTDMLSLLVANSVTGAASVFRRDLLSTALPFPPGQFAHYHDHWIALNALASGGIGYVDKPLYDYVQHGQASLGHAAANAMTPLRERLRHQRGARERVRMWRLHYYVDVCRLLALASILQLRHGPRMTASARRALVRFSAAEDSRRALARLAMRGLRDLSASTSETLGAEWMLAHAFLWRRLLALSARDRPQRRLRLDAVPPASLFQEPGRKGRDQAASGVADKIAPLRWRLAEDAPRRINLLIPTMDTRHFFGGYIAKLNLARRLIEMGERVRVVTVDPSGPLPREWRQELGRYSGLQGLFDRLEIVFGRESAGIEVSPADGFIATTWWTAHIAQQAIEIVDAERFLYLVQEYEPFTFPMGTFAALAEQSYTFAHFALFSSELLRGYFRRHAIGVYAAGPQSGDECSVAFQNAITRVPRPSESELAARTTRRLLFYARPEPHAARNMYELGLLALSQAVADGAFQDGWELHGIGTVQGAKRISLGAGATLELLPRSDQSSYSTVLGQHDVGLALMYTPHPSLVPIEMASAGMLTVTNRFENKTPEAMASISSNLITVEPTVDGISRGLRDAAASVSDYGRRSAGSEVSWCRDWSTALPDELVARLLPALGRPDEPRR
jgi:glycosyltransferase involved in cell wall biosynthesis